MNIEGSFDLMFTYLRFDKNATNRGHKLLSLLAKNIPSDTLQVDPGSS